jgi:hypothetical protein
MRTKADAEQVARRSLSDDGGDAVWIPAVFEADAPNQMAGADDVCQVGPASRRRVAVTLPLAIGACLLLVGAVLVHVLAHPAGREASQPVDSATAAPAVMAAPQLAAPSSPPGCPAAVSCVVRPAAGFDLRQTVERLFGGGDVVWAVSTIDAHSGRVYQIQLQVAAPAGVHVLVVSQRARTPVTSNASVAWTVSNPNSRDPVRPHYAVEVLTGVRGPTAITVRISAHQWVLSSLPVAAAEQLAESPGFLLN